MTILKYKDENGDWQTFSNTTIGNADTLDGHTASETPTAGQIPVIKSGGDLDVAGDIYSNGGKVPVVTVNTTAPTSPKIGDIWVEV